MPSLKFNKINTLFRPTNDFKTEHLNISIQMPVIKREVIPEKVISNLKAINFQNVRLDTIYSDRIVFHFRYDTELNRMWNSTLESTRKLIFRCNYTSTPDFSVYPGMNQKVILDNTYKNRYLGALWQTLGCHVFPTISWADQDSYDICFSGVEKHSIVVISTLGVSSGNIDMFLRGYNEMKKRLEPEIIFVYGNKIEGMSGRCKFFLYRDAIESKYKQIDLFQTEKDAIEEIA